LPSEPGILAPWPTGLAAAPAGLDEATSADFAPGILAAPCAGLTVPSAGFAEATSADFAAVALATVDAFDLSAGAAEAPDVAFMKCSFTARTSLSSRLLLCVFLTPNLVSRKSCISLLSSFSLACSFIMFLSSKIFNFAILTTSVNLLLHF
jgi:hypothetical protein